MFLHEEVPVAELASPREAALPAGEMAPPAGDVATPPGAAAAPVVAGDLKMGVFYGFLAVVLVTVIGAIVLYAIGEDAAAQVILPVGTGLLGLLTGQYLGEKATNQ